jgi:hypothetical protein
VKVPLTQGQFDALCDLVLNMGAGNFKKSSLLARLNRGDYAGARAAFDLYVNSGRPAHEAGLVRRRDAEQLMWDEGGEEAQRPARGRGFRGDAEGHRPRRRQQAALAVEHAEGRRRPARRSRCRPRARSSRRRASARRGAERHRARHRGGRPRRQRHRHGQDRAREPAGAGGLLAQGRAPRDRSGGAGDLRHAGDRGLAFIGFERWRKHRYEAV